MCAEAGVDTFALVRERYLGKHLAIFNEDAKPDPRTARGWRLPARICARRAIVGPST
jgi:hypothetical protein